MSNRTSCNYIKLKDAAVLIPGSTPSRRNKECYAKKGLPWAKIENLDQGEVIETREYLSSEGARRVKLIPRGSSLVSVIGTVGRVGIAGVDLAANQQIIAVYFLPERGVLDRYGYYYLKYSSQKIRDMAYATVEKRVSSGRLEQFVLPVPSIEAQKQIIFVMDQVEEYVTLQRKKIGMVQQFGESLGNGWMMEFVLPTINEKKKELRVLADKLLEQSELLLESFLQQIFDAWEKDKNERYLMQQSGKPAESDSAESGLSDVLQTLLGQLSVFQKKMYLEFLRNAEMESVHSAFRSVQKQRGVSDSSQNADSSVRILRELGLLEHQEGQILYYSDGKTQVLDEKGQPLAAQMWSCCQERIPEK